MKFGLSLVAVFTFGLMFGQVPKNVILEHFTNTKCSICANSNPALNSNLNNNPDVLRVSYHPSSPYNTCALNLDNVLGNDDRTNYYNVYGGTPRIVIQGDVQSPGTSNFSSSTLFDNYKGEMSSVGLNLTIDTTELDSLLITVNIVTESNLSAGEENSILYVAIAEDSIFYNAPNGEDLHINVFREALNGNSGTAISLVNVVGASTTVSFKVEKNIDWNIERMFGFATVQDATSKEIYQSEFSVPSVSSDISQDKISTYSYRLFDNTLSLELEGNHSFLEVVLLDITGKRIDQNRVDGNDVSINLNNIKNGIYIVNLISSRPSESRSFKISK